MSEPSVVSWWKVPIIGVPGFPGCDVQLTIDGSPVQEEGDVPTGTCGRDTTWMLGGAHVCADHFPLVASLLGDSADAIEAAWREQA